MRGDRLVIVDGEADTAAVRRYEASRRILVRKGVLFGGLTVAAAAVPALLRVEGALARADGDVGILEGALELEQTAVVAYEAAVGSGRLQPEERRTAKLFGDQEQEHADALVAALKNLGGTPPAKPAGPEEVEGLAEAVATGRGAILQFAVALEEMAVAAYYRAQQKLTDAKLLQTAASIMGNEGQHLVVLRLALGRSPVPNAFETGKASSQAGSA